MPRDALLGCGPRVRPWAAKLLALVVLCAAPAAAAPLVSYRAWQFHKLDVPYVSATMKLARDYDVNTVVFSHSMIGYASQLFDGSDRGEKLRRLAREAHALDLRVWIWVRELQNVPERFIEGKVVQLDRPGLWEWLESRYEEVFERYPEFDGIILTFHETQYKIFKPGEVASALSMPERFTRMIDTIAKVCSRRGKDLVVRSFLYEPRELAWFREGYARTRPEVMIQTKCEPHDWQPYYPHHPLIGAFPDRRQIVEFDASSEYTGRNRIPYTQPEYFERRWRYALSKRGVAGYNARLDHGGYDAMGTPNQINIYALSRFTADAGVTAADVWREWTGMRYGRAAAEVEQALKPAFDIVNRSFFTLGFWMTNHSRLPDFAYADGHLRSRSTAKWYPDDARYKELEMRLRRPDPATLEEILAEKDSAVALAHRSLVHLENARPALTAEQYGDLYWRLALLARTAAIWKLHAEAFYGYKVLAEGHRAPGLKERAERALRALEAEAEVSAADPRIGSRPPASAGELRGFVTDLRRRLAALTN